jgi:hypothetical protein
MAITSITADLLVVTPDQLRKINLRLTKKTQSETVDWELVFGLQEREKTTDPFNDLVKLTVAISKQNNKKAQATADSGLDKAQTSAAFAAGDAAKLFNEGQLSQSAAELSAKRVISSRKDA